MSRTKSLCATLAVLLCTPLAFSPVPSAAKAPAQTRYRVVDMGSFGGGYGAFQNRAINLRGMAVGVMMTAEPDPFVPNCFFTCNMDRAFLYDAGKTWDLGALAEHGSSLAAGITDLGIAYGYAQNGKVDASTGFPETHAVMWLNKRIIDLGTLGGSQGIVVSMNLLGQGAGGSLNAKPDPYAATPMQACLHLPNNGPAAGSVEFAFNSFFAPASTETRATYWWGGTKRDMGTLGGPDSYAYFINELGQAVGWSYTSYQANEFGHPDVHPFIWSAWDRKMHDLGTLGGACAYARIVNNRGQVIGASNLADNMSLHPFVWTARSGMRDLGTLGGTYGHADAINDAGEIVGYATTARDAQGHVKGRAFYWKNGVMKNLGTLDDDDASQANGINNRGQIVGETFLRSTTEALRGWISDRGGPLIDLNTLIPADSGYFITAAIYINDRGEIAAQAITADGEEHPVKLVPVK